MYSWMLSLWDDEGLIDMCDVKPEMHVTIESFQHRRDEWSGILNIPSQFEIHSGRASTPAVAKTAPFTRAIATEYANKDCAR